MITVRYSDMSISVQGHAGYAESGSDIVCAGVSTAVNCLIQTVRARKWTGAKLIVKDDIVMVGLKPWPFCGRAAAKFLDDFVAVCRNMAREYPHNITVMEVI